MIGNVASGPLWKKTKLKNLRNLIITVTELYGVIIIMS
jgi:hypothetical protein